MLIARTHGECSSSWRSQLLLGRTLRMSQGLSTTFGLHIPGDRPHLSGENSEAEMAVCDTPKPRSAMMHSFNPPHGTALRQDRIVLVGLVIIVAAGLVVQVSSFAGQEGTDKTSQVRRYTIMSGQFSVVQNAGDQGPTVKTRSTIMRLDTATGEVAYYVEFEGSMNGVGGWIESSECSDSLRTVGEQHGQDHLRNLLIEMQGADGAK